MGTASLTEPSVAETYRRVAEIWERYKQTHDPASWHGQSVGFDPDTGRVFVAPTADEAVGKARAEGVGRPLVFLWVGRLDAARMSRRLVPR